MNADQFYLDLINKANGDAPDSGVDAANKELGESATGQQQSLGRLKTFGEAMVSSMPDSQKRNEVMKAMEPFLRRKIGTNDIGSLLLTSLSPRMPFVVQTETPLLNMMEAAPGPRLTTNDWVYRTSLRNQGATRASKFHPEGTISTTDHATVRSESTNTLGFYGDPVSATIVGRNQAQQQRNVNVLKQEIDAELIAIRKALNYDGWNGKEQKAIQTGNVPAFGGLKERTATFTTNVAGATNLTETLMKKIVVDLGSVWNPSAKRIMFASVNQVDATRTIEIARYSNGEGSASYNATQQMLRSMFGDAAKGIVIDRVYDQPFGGPLPVVHDYDLTTEAMVITLEDQFIPKLVYFLIDGEEGPHQLLRPVYDLKETVLVFGGYTIDDSAENTRDYLYNLAS